MCLKLRDHEKFDKRMRISRKNEETIAEFFALDRKRAHEFPRGKKNKNAAPDAGFSENVLSFLFFISGNSSNISTNSEWESRNCKLILR